MIWGDNGNLFKCPHNGRFPLLFGETDCREIVLTMENIGLQQIDVWSWA